MSKCAINTDHKPLCFVLKKVSAHPNLGRWVLQLQNYNTVNSLRMNRIGLLTTLGRRYSKSTQRWAYWHRFHQMFYLQSHSTTFLLLRCNHPTKFYCVMLMGTRSLHVYYRSSTKMHSFNALLSFFVRISYPTIRIRAASKVFGCR